jgi:hypothetical protein
MEMLTHPTTPSDFETLSLNVPLIATHTSSNGEWENRSVAVSEEEGLSRFRAGVFGGSLSLNLPCQVVLAYEDLETARHAQGSYNFVLRRLEQSLAATSSLWKFNLLQNTKLRRMAAREAAEADVGIISTHANCELPPAVKEWLEELLTLRNSVPANLVVVFPDTCDSYPERTATQKYLQDAATRGGMKFLAETPDWAKGLKE